MARRHNIYSNLLGTVENNPQSLLGGYDMGNNDVGVICDDLNDMATSIRTHADRLDDHADNLRSGIPEGLISEGQGDIGLPRDHY